MEYDGEWKCNENRSTAIDAPPHPTRCGMRWTFSAKLPKDYIHSFAKWVLNTGPHKYSHRRIEKKRKRGKLSTRNENKVECNAIRIRLTACHPQIISLEEKKFYPFRFDFAYTFSRTLKSYSIESATKEFHFISVERQREKEREREMERNVLFGFHQLHLIIWFLFSCVESML